MKERNKQSEVYRMAESMSRTFIVRKDIQARQLDDGSYVCIRKPLTMDHMVKHLKGKITLGTYVLTEDNKTRFVVFDADNDGEFKKLHRTAVEIPSYIETSRRGGHLWMFTEMMEGTQARNFGLAVSKEYNLDVEVFPKQGKSEGPGSLVRVPFGIHRKSGERYKFYNLGTWRDQIAELSKPMTVPEEIIEKYKYEPKPRSLRTTENALWDKVKAKVPVRDFIGAFVELKDTGDSAVGYCPFHDDDHPSFGVNNDENYWSCFAGCGGGTIIDFWMKWRGVEFKEAVKELSEFLGVER